MSSGVHLWLGRDFPYGTLFVNVLGSLLMGLLYVVLIERTGAAEVWRAGLLVGEQLSNLVFRQLNQAAA